MRSAHLRVDAEDPGTPIDRRLFGSFVEHLGRAVYTGVWEPDHPSADPQGFRRDVVDLVKGLGISTVRYPGGNFVSNFRWEDSVGPRELRPRRLDLAWHSIETNQVGLHEFSDWLDLVGADLMLAVNLGTRGTAEALELLEYTNIASGTTRADQRREHGRDAPFDVRTWCLGNEMDGPWQVGHRSADDYGALAARTASAMRMVDPDLQLVVCGSSGRQMPTFGAWERTVLSHTYDHVDLISCHAYYEEHDGDLASFLASAVDMDAFIDSVAETIDAVRAEKQSDREVAISFDEWNVWYHSRYEREGRITGVDTWPVAPRLLEDSYTVADAVVVGSLLISLLRHADRVRAASLAQLVNVIAPVMTEPGGPAWRQTTYFPFALTSRFARGRVLPITIDCDTLETAEHGRVDLVDAVVTRDTDGGTAIFLVNRSTESAVTVSVDLGAVGPVTSAHATTLHDEEPYARNTLSTPDRVRPRANPTLTMTAGTTAGRATLELPPVSWSVVVLEP